VEIGWGLYESARGKGYATEAAAAVIQWAFQQPHICSMSATIADDNRASQRVAQRLGLARSYAIRLDLPLWKIEKISTGD
jgi:RimJ/RimL family protein N-acetyltransferase